MSTMTNRYCLTLHLKDDPELIREYEEYHRDVWPEVLASLKDSGIVSMQIYRFRTTLAMIIEVSEEFSFEGKREADRRNPKVQEWEELMWRYQQPFPGAREGEKWMLMDMIFNFDAG